MSTRTRTEAAARSARSKPVDEQVHEDTTSAGQEEQAPAEGAQDAQSSTAGCRQRRATKMTMPKKGNGGGDDDPDDGDGDDFQELEDDDPHSHAACLGVGARGMLQDCVACSTLEGLGRGRAT